MATWAGTVRVMPCDGSRRSQRWRYAVDANTFDDLVKRLTTTPQTRTSVLRGLVASAIALAGMTLVPESGTAKKNHENERKVCVCGADGTVASCHTKKVKADKIKKLLRRNPCAFKGKCTGVNPCSTVSTGTGGGDGTDTGGDGTGTGTSGGSVVPGLRDTHRRRPRTRDLSRERGVLHHVSQLRGYVL